MLISRHPYGVVYIMYSAQLTDKQHKRLNSGWIGNVWSVKKLKGVSMVRTDGYRLSLLKNAKDISNKLLSSHNRDSKTVQEALYHGDGIIAYGRRFESWLKTDNPAAYTVIDRYLEDTAELTKLLEQNISPEMRKRVGDELLRLALIAHDKVAKIMQHDACALSEIDARDVERDFAYEEERRFNDVFALEALEKTNAISEY